MNRYSISTGGRETHCTAVQYSTVTTTTCCCCCSRGISACEDAPVSSSSAALPPAPASAVSQGCQSWAPHSHTWECQSLAALALTWPALLWPSCSVPACLAQRGDQAGRLSVRRTAKGGSALSNTQSTYLYITHVRTVSLTHITHSFIPAPNSSTPTPPHLVVQSMSPPLAVKHPCIVIVEEALAHGALEGCVGRRRVLVNPLHQLQPHGLWLLVLHEGRVVSQLLNWVWRGRRSRV